MYSITQSPALALAVARAIQDEKRRHPATTPRRPKARHGGRRPAPWPLVWARRHAVAV
jgi:hypothetical protein